MFLIKHTHTHTYAYITCPTTRKKKSEPVKKRKKDQQSFSCGSFLLETFFLFFFFFFETNATHLRNEIIPNDTTGNINTGGMSNGHHHPKHSQLPYFIIFFWDKTAQHTPAREKKRPLNQRAREGTRGARR